MIDINSLKSYLASDLEKVRGIMRNSLSSGIDLLNDTNESVISHPGKMMRPSMALLVAKLCNKGNLTEDSYNFAAASELLHNATLFHDDVADNSSCRRGRPTIMKLLGGRASVLLGDFWLVRALDRILSSEQHHDEAIRLCAKTLGDLAEGEMLQLQKAASSDTVEEDYFEIIYRKTASLFETIAKIAALSVDAAPWMKEAVGLYARKIGIAFQIKDDILDYHPTADIGKPAGHDLLEQKITLPLLGAMQNAPECEAEKIRMKVSKIHENPDFQGEIVEFVDRYSGMDYAARKLDKFVAEALGDLDPFPESKEKEMLAILARYIAVRNN